MSAILPLLAGMALHGGGVVWRGLAWQACVHREERPVESLRAARQAHTGRESVGRWVGG